MLNWIVENTAVACMLAVVALGATYFYRSRPALCHMLWVIVLIRLVMPPIAVPGWPPRELKSAVRNAIQVALPSVGSAPVPLSSSVYSEPASAALAWGEAEASGFEAMKRDPWGWQSAQLGGPKYMQESQYVSSGESWSEPVVASKSKVSKEAITAAVQDMDRHGAMFWGVLAVWAAGSLGFLSLWLSRTMRFREAIARTSPAPVELKLAVDAVAKDLGLRPPRIRMNGSMGGPSLWCFGRPVLLWPDSMAHESEEVIRPVIAHELSHLRRRDHWTAWLEMAATLVMWWHPLLWIARKQLRLYAELACDARVVASMPTERRHYAESLIIAAASCPNRQPPAALAAVDANRRTFEQRVRLIMQGRMSDHLSLASVIALIAVTMVVAPTWAGAVGSWWFPTQIAPSVHAAVAGERLSVRADKYYLQETWGQSAAAYEEVVANDPDNGAALHRLGVSLLNSGKPECALEVISDQIAVGHREDEAYFLRARAHATIGNAREATLALQEALVHGFVDRERIECDSALVRLIYTNAEAREIAKDLAETTQLVLDAENDLKEREWWSARSKLRTAAGVSPLSGRVQRQLALAAEHVNLFHEAESAWKREHTLGHDKAEAMFNVARMRSADGQIQAAVAAIEEAIALGFRDAARIEEDAWLEAVRQDSSYDKLIFGVREPQRLRELVGRAIQAERYAYAAAAADKLLDLDGLNKHQRGVAHHGKGMALLGLGRTEEASVEFLKQIELGFWLTEGLYRIACCRSAEGKGAEAFAYLEAAVEAGMYGDDKLRDYAILASISATDRFVRVFELAQDNWTLLVMFQAADWEHLEHVSRIKIRADEGNGKAHLHLGWALLRLGKYDEAIVVFKKQGQLEHLPGIAHYNVACGYALKNDKKNALMWLHASQVAKGFDPAHAITDPDLANLRGDPVFERMCGNLAE